MKSPIWYEYGTPEEEAMRWKILPWYIRYSRMHDHYLQTVKYYDKPDGEDLLGKLVAINRCIAPYVVMVAGAHTFMHSPDVVTNQQRFARFVHHLWPAFGAATAFATVTFFSTKIRQKDD